MKKKEKAEENTIPRTVSTKMLGMRARELPGPFRAQLYKLASGCHWILGGVKERGFLFVKVFVNY